MDVVYVVGPNPDRNEELRFSLRSLSNLPHDRVWIAGACPAWARNVTHIPVVQRRSRWENSSANLLAACGHPEVSDPFIFFNDDFFVMEPVAEVPTLHRGPLDDMMRWAGGTYRSGVRATRRMLVDLGYDDILSYELHVPMIVGKGEMLTALDFARRIRRNGSTCKRTIYGTLFRVGGEFVDDVKIVNKSDLWDPRLPFTSTHETSFGSGAIGRQIRVRFPHPSDYEEDPGMTEIEELREHAERIGINVDGRWGVARLTQEIAEHANEDGAVMVDVVADEPQPDEPPPVAPAPVPERPLSRIRYWRHVESGKRRNTTRGSGLDAWYEDSPEWTEE